MKKNSISGTETIGGETVNVSVVKNQVTATFSKDGIYLQITKSKNENAEIGNPAQPPYRVNINSNSPTGEVELQAAILAYIEKNFETFQKEF
jgi:hypothetical protein